MTDARGSQLVVRSFDESTPEDLVSQLAVRSVYNYPAEADNISQIILRSFDESTPTARTSQLTVRALVRGRVADPSLKVWTYSMDNHDYYVLRLGDDTTFVYDLYSDQWVEWATPAETFWRVNTGCNWQGGTRNDPEYGSNVVAGDDTWGLIWFLNPTQPYDEHPNEDINDELYFERIAMGQIPVSGRTVVPCYVVHLSTDSGDPAYTGATVALETSDDAGHTFTNHGEIEVVAAQFAAPELAWYSLGQIGAPGRLFKITDDGAVTRIDEMNMNDDG